VPAAAQYWTSEYVVNVVKVNYNRIGENDYASHIVVEDKDSIFLSKGKSKDITIDAVNSFMAENAAEYLTTQIVTRVFPMFARPVKIVRRSIAPSLYGLTPGDSVSLTDDLVRDPATGRRGLSARGAVCLESFHDYGHGGGKMYGEAVLLLSDEDRTYPLSPAMEIDVTYNTSPFVNGYDSAGKRFKIKNASFGRSGAPTDVSHFDAGDLVTIMEYDPLDPGNPTAWTRELLSVNVAAGTATLSTSIASPSWDGSSTKRYVIFAQAYADCQASQHLHAFMADNAVDDIQGGEAEPNLYADFDIATDFSAGSGALNPGLIAEDCVQDGQPVTPFLLRQISQLADNLLRYKKAVNVPFNFTTPLAVATSPISTYRLVMMFPIGLGLSIASGHTRNFKIAPMFRVGSVGTAKVRVTSTDKPPSGSSLYGLKYSGVTHSVEWTTTSTTYSVSTSQSLPIAENGGVTWIVIEATASNTCYIRGFPTFYEEAES
jgi:hypothetical protein